MRANTILKGIRPNSLGLFCIAVSVGGFFLENIWLLVTRGVIDNRNMRLPCLLGYGIGMSLLYILIGTPKDHPFSRLKSRIAARLLYFLLAFFAVSSAELILGHITELFLGFAYWDYSSLPLSFTKYTSLPTSIAFGIIITLFMEFAARPMLRLFDRLPRLTSNILSVSLLSLLFADMVFSFYRMYSAGGLDIIWQIRL